MLKRLKPSAIKGSFQHHLNELHLYCHFRKWGLPHPIAKTIAQTVSPKRLIYSKKFSQGD